MKYHVEFDIDFKRNPYKGLYLVFEGVNTAGKTTQLERTKAYFEKQGKNVVVTSEPNDQLAIGKLIRSILNGDKKVPASALQYLYTADRIVNHETIVIPALKQGGVVLSSRSLWSAIVYGILDRGADYTRPDADLLLVAQGILSMYHQFMLPNVTFYLNISIDTVMVRLAKTHKIKDIYENKNTLAQLTAGYQWVVEQFREEFVTIDGEKSIDEVHRQIIKILEGKP